MGYPKLLIVIALLAQVKGFAQQDALKLIISIEEQKISSPFPARITLHLHNAGQQTVWLYRHVAPWRGTPAQAEFAEAPEALNTQTTGGSTLAVELESEESKPAALGQGEALTSVGFPHPKLIRLAPGGDYEEKTSIALTPAGARQPTGESRPVWGRYKLALTYAAKYSNGEEMVRILGVNLWQAEVTSNAAELELEPPPATARGSIAGTIVGPHSVGMGNVLVSLTDQQLRLVGQGTTDVEGRYSFAGLPLGLYGVTARRKNSDEDTTVFRHVTLEDSAPAGRVEIMLTPPDVYQAEQLSHKPVLFRVTDSSGRPVDKVRIEGTWSSGTVLDNVKGEASEDGTAVLDLLPGRNFLTLTKKGCPKEEQRVDVAPGGGIDGFKLTFDCARR